MPSSSVRSALNKLMSNSKELSTVLLLVLFGIIGLVADYSWASSSTASEQKLTVVFIALLIVMIGGILFTRRIATKCRIEVTFLCIAILLSIFALFAFPPYSNPDGTSHFFRAFEVVLGNFSTPIATSESMYAYLPEGLSPLDSSSTLSSFAASMNADVDFEHFTTYEVRGISLYSPLSVFPTVIALAACLPFTHNLLFLLYASRIINLCVVLAALYLSIKYIPFAKRSLAFVSLFPMSLELYNSNSPDGLTIAFAFLMVALVFRARYNSKFRFTLTTAIPLFISMIVLSGGKIVYFPLVALILLIPSSSLNRNPKIGHLCKAGSLLVCAVIFLGWLLISSKMLVDTQFNPGHSIDSAQQLKYVISSPGTFLLTCIHTLYENGFTWFQWMIGSDLRLLDLHISGIYILFFSILLVVVLLFDRSYTSLKDKTLLICCLILFVILVGAIFLSLYLQWTNLYQDTIEGIQGRYFTPLIPLAFVPLMYGKRTVAISSSEKKTLKKRFDVVMWPLIFGLNFCIFTQALLIVL